MHTKTDVSSSAFTLLEMAIVLAILALLTHLAVVRLTDGTLRPRQAERLLDEMERGIRGRAGEVDPSGQPTWTGFVADMGRLPRATAPENGWDAFGELRVCPEDGEYAVRAATAGNLVPGTDASDADPLVHLACGWNGPYASFSEGRILDPWGNGVEPLDGAGNPAPAGTEISFVRCLGSDGSPGWDGRTDTARDMVRTNLVEASLAVIPTFRVVSTNEAATLSVDMVPRPTRLRVYSPCGSRIAVRRTEELLVASGGVLEVDGLTPGPRVFRLEREGVRGPVVPVVLKPGPNVVRLP